MDYAKVTKQELIDVIEEQNKKIDSLQHVEKKIKDVEGSFEEKKRKALEHLEKQIEELELLLEEKQNALVDQIKARDESINHKIKAEEALKESQHTLVQTTKHYEKLQEESDKKYAFLEMKFNELVVIFDEYAVAFKDQVKVYEAIFKSSTYVVNVLESKIKKFNGEIPEKEGN